MEASASVKARDGWSAVRPNVVPREPYENRDLFPEELERLSNWANWDS